jgi:hypothetical protein
MIEPWWADLPVTELDDRGREFVLAQILDMLVYRNVDRDDLREAIATAAALRTTRQ